MSVAWIGLGNMGGPMAANLVAAGTAVRGHDISEAAGRAAAGQGVEVVGSVADAVRDADIVFTMLPRGEHVREVLTAPDGVLANVRPGTLVVDESTIDIDLARELHRTTTDAGARFLDAPVSGGVSGAAAGTLTIMVGGRAEDLEEARPHLEVLGGRVVHAGDAGNGQAAKIVNNMMCGVILGVTCEAAVLSKRLGLDPATFHSIAASSSGDSWVLRTWYPEKGVVESAAVNRDFEGGFSVALLHKDLGLAVNAGESTGTSLPFVTRARDAMAALVDAGQADRDCTVLVRQVDGSLDAPAG
ncbi:3-hydroxyisobutyrate dehydrogenase [Geodermatophilus pulveris]|uniref:3-hydroxyisobutyrate dehydrogenase n=1 Tax=Geodermatophilus pulveris TaxID=1564159 RepID=A0A239DZF0_9ACTN|nr:3-hydroxyisobutyrate dehydrogenase [Geodermatophilus pulveris]SNS37398.1 3-hydroxyisobutyrate dehydrogenase [Geodermatophilus pulveris]